jgi:hypothetical protein
MGIPYPAFRGWKNYPTPSIVHQQLSILVPFLH